MNHYFTDNSTLRSELKEIQYKTLDNTFVFWSDLGVFSKDKIDYGSNLLIETYLNVNKSSKKVLDIGCGYGIIGIVISKITNSEVDMIDVNRRCIHLTEMNIEKNKVNANVFYSDAYNEVNNTYDIIITNPPIRTGKEKVLEILSGAKKHLNKEGELWFVIRKNQGALSIKKILEKNYFIEIIGKSKGYYIFIAKMR